MFEAIKSIGQVQPKMFTVENVKGLLSTNGGEDWKKILHDFCSLKGYSISWGIMNAKHNGTPQNRVRVFIVGFRTDCDAMPFPVQLSLDKCVLDILEDEVDDKYYLSQKMIDGFAVNNNCKSSKVGYINQNTQASTVFDAKDIAPNLCAGTHGYANGYVLVKTNTKKGHEVAQIGDTIDLKGIKSKTRRGIINHQIAHCLDTQCYQAIVEPFIVASRGRNPKNPSDRTAGVPTKQRLEPNFSGCGAKTGLYLMGWHIRRLTPRECARLFGDFDDKFQFGEFKDTKLYEFIGNAIDINTYSRLLEQMLEFSQNIFWDEPSLLLEEVI